MDVRLSDDECLDVSAEERRTRELVKRIRKLRWMGMEEEAEQLQSKLPPVLPGEVLIAGPRDID